MNIKLWLAKLAARLGRRKTVNYIHKNCQLMGEHFLVPRENDNPVEVYLHRPADKEGALPVVFNIHGGAWVGGDALMLNTQSQEMADRLGAMVVNINYTKADVRPFPYLQYEVLDTVKYFATHENDYGIDPARFAVMGYSADGHLSACAAQLLKEEGFPLSCQILCYPFLDFTYGNGEEKEIKESIGGVSGLKDIFFPDLEASDSLVSPGNQADSQFPGLAPAIIVACGTDPLRIQAQRYAQRLKNAGICVTYIEYPEALHGFLEVNFPETKEDNEAKNSRQAELRRQCEHDIAALLFKLWS